MSNAISTTLRLLVLGATFVVAFVRVWNLRRTRLNFFMMNNAISITSSLLLLVATSIFAYCHFSASLLLPWWRRNRSRIEWFEEVVPPPTSRLCIVKPVTSNNRSSVCNEMHQSCAFKHRVGICVRGVRPPVSGLRGKDITLMGVRLKGNIFFLFPKASAKNCQQNLLTYNATKPRQYLASI